MIALSNRRGLVGIVVAILCIVLFAWAFSALGDLRRNDKRYIEADSRFEKAALKGNADEAAAARSDREAARSAGGSLDFRSRYLLVGAAVALLLAATVLPSAFRRPRSSQPTTPAARRPPAR